MGQAEILEIAASFIAGIILIGTLSWLVGKKSSYFMILNSLLGGIIVILLSVFKLLILSPPVMFLSGLMGIAGVIIAFFVIL
ncbi:MAG: hypothetical protein ACOX3U_06200 [Christensenellales bacterium]|jgi:hypothetical protein